MMDFFIQRIRHEFAGLGHIGDGLRRSKQALCMPHALCLQEGVAHEEKSDHYFYVPFDIGGLSGSDLNSEATP